MRAHVAGMEGMSCTGTEGMNSSEEEGAIGKSDCGKVPDVVNTGKTDATGKPVI